MHTRARSSKFVASLLCSFLAVVAGCAAIDPKAVGSFREGVATVQKDSMTLLLGVNRVAREAQLDRAANQDTLGEEDVAAALDQESLARWNLAFESMRRYASSLEVLLSPEKSAAIEKSITDLGGSITALVPDPPDEADELSKAVGRIGRLIVQQAANGEAMAVMRKADADVRLVLATAADILGTNPTHPGAAGVRTTMFSNWTTLAAKQQEEFLKAAKGGARRAIAARYAELLESRATSDAALASLQTSLGALADAHSAASQGRAGDAAAVIAMLREQVKFASELLASATKK